MKTVWSKAWDRFDQSKLSNINGSAQVGVWSKLATWTSRRAPSKLPSPFMTKCASAKYPTLLGTPNGESQTCASTNAPLSQMVFQFFVVHASDTINTAEMSPMAMAPLKPFAKASMACKHGCVGKHGCVEWFIQAGMASGQNLHRNTMPDAA